MKINGDNLQAGLDTLSDELTMSDYKYAFELYEAMVRAGAIPFKAIDETLQLAVRGLDDEKTKLKAAREAAGVTPAQRSEQPTVKSDVLQPLRPAKATSSKTKTAAARAAKRLSDSDNKFIAHLAKWFIIGVFFGALLTFLTMGFYELRSGEDTSFWAGWPIIPITAALFVVIAYLRATRPEKHDDEEEHTTPNTSSSLRELGLNPTA